MRINKEQLLVNMARQRMSARDLIERSGLSDQTVRRATRGARCNPATAGKIADALGVDVADLVEID